MILGSVLSSAACVAMVQPAKHRQRIDTSTFRRLGFAGLWTFPSEAQMSARIVIISEISAENFAQMKLVDHDHVVDAVLADGTDHPFDAGILPRGAVCGDDLCDSRGLNTEPDHGACTRSRKCGLDPESHPER